MNKYAELSLEELEKHLDGYLIDQWSVSAVGEFIRNEKSFERKYIFKDRDTERSLASIIGTVYHESLMNFFLEFQAGRKMGYDELLLLAHAHLDHIGADEYQAQKNKTIEQQQQEALKAVNAAMKSFLAEFSAYENEIEEVLFIEETFREFVTINGIDIPLPLKGTPDIVFINKQGELCCFDHKCKKMYTPEKDVNMKYGNQSMSYALLLGVAILKFPDIVSKWPKVQQGVSKFFFYENKYTQNRDGSRQIVQIPIDIKESRALFEQILFEGVMRVIQAVQDPDYIYLMNPNDFFVDGADMIEFWIKTHLQGLEGFPNLSLRQIKLLKGRKERARHAAFSSIPKNVIKAFSSPKDFISINRKDMEALTNEKKIEHRLATLNYRVNVEPPIEGYSCDTFLVQPEAGKKTSSIFGYRLDIANVLGVRDVRIPSSLVEYQGGAFIAIEVNRREARPLIFNAGENVSGNVFPIGKTNFGETISWSIDNPSTPHMMIAGASGSGKSVTVRTIIEVAKSKGIKVAILDPKYEFTDMRSKGFEVYNEPDEIETFMLCKVSEMDRIFKEGGGGKTQKQLIIFDEAADCLSRKEYGTLENSTLLLAQKARSAGIHLLLAAQRFSVKILTGDAKANFPTRLCLTVASAIDSKVMLGVEGAEKLNGRGDALFISPSYSEPVRIQCFATA